MSNAFDFSGPSLTGAALQKVAKHRETCTRVADEMREKFGTDSATIFGAGKIEKRDYKKMKMKKHSEEER